MHIFWEGGLQEKVANFGHLSAQTTPFDIYLLSYIKWVVYIVLIHDLKHFK